MVPVRPALADIRDQFDALNKRDRETLRVLKIDEIAKWEAVRDNTQSLKLLSRCDDDSVLNELSYMSSFYHKPLSVERKVMARESLFRMYDHKNATETEKQLLLNIMNYFDLFE